YDARTAHPCATVSVNACTTACVSLPVSVAFIPKDSKCGVISIGTSGKLSSPVPGTTSATTSPFTFVSGNSEQVPSNWRVTNSLTVSPIFCSKISPSISSSPTRNCWSLVGILVTTIDFNVPPVPSTLQPAWLVVHSVNVIVDARSVPGLPPVMVPSSLTFLHVMTFVPEVSLNSPPSETTFLVSPAARTFQDHSPVPFPALHLCSDHSSVPPFSHTSHSSRETLTLMNSPFASASVQAAFL